MSDSTKQLKEDLDWYVQRVTYYGEENATLRSYLERIKALRDGYKGGYPPDYAEGRKAGYRVCGDLAEAALRVSDGNRDGEDAQRLRPEGMTARCHEVADAMNYLIRNVLKPTHPDIQPLDDLLGVCTQVDHVTAGLKSALSSSKARIETLETALKEIEALPSFRMDEASMIARSALRSKGETGDAA